MINAFWEYYQNPKAGEVYNIGGSRFANISILEAIDVIKELSGHELKYKLSEEARIGDHMWYVSDVSKFQNDYPGWNYEYDIKKTMKEMIEVAENS